jgi:hypothetical protein
MMREKTAVSDVSCHELSAVIVDLFTDCLPNHVDIERMLSCWSISACTIAPAYLLASLFKQVDPAFLLESMLNRLDRVSDQS